jgi:hypothetical protein
MEGCVNEISRVATEESPAAEVTVAGDREIAVQGQPDSLLSAIVLMAKDPAVDIQKLDRLLAMQERLEARQAEQEFNAATARLAKVMPRVKKNGTVNLIKKDGTDGGSYSFAKWEDMDAILRPLYTAEGFSLSFDAEPRQGEGGGLVVTGRLSHDRGHSRTASLPLALDAGAGRNNLQAMGSTLSYGKRYTAEMLLNIVREGTDDDGIAGGKKYLASDQVVELVELCKATKTEEGRFLEMMTSAARSMEEVEAADYTRLKNALMVKRQQQQAKAAKP